MQPPKHETPISSHRPNSTGFEQLSQEAAYLKSLGEKRKPISVKLTGGEIVYGWIEYYDKNMVRLTREEKPNLFIFKHEIMYIAEDAGKRK